MSRPFFDTWGVRKWRDHFDAKVTVEVSLAIKSKTIRNAVIRAVENGYLPTARGAAAKWYELVRIHYDLPGIVFSEGGGGKFWRSGVNTYSMPTTVHEMLHDWWTADRVAARLDHAALSGSAKQAANYSFIYRMQEKEPDWGGDSEYASIMTDKARSNFAPIGAALVAMPEYQVKAQRALAAIRNGETVTIDLSRKQHEAEIIELLPITKLVNSVAEAA
jgi:hypothetical protein